MLNVKGNQVEADQLYEQILASEPDNVMALNSLAWSYRESNPSRALDYATKANDLFPESWIILDTLAVVLMHNGELPRARR